MDDYYDDDFDFDGVESPFYYENPRPYLRLWGDHTKARQDTQALSQDILAECIGSSEDAAGALAGPNTP